MVDGSMVNGLSIHAMQLKPENEYENLPSERYQIGLEIKPVAATSEAAVTNELAVNLYSNSQQPDSSNIGSLPLIKSNVMSSQNASGTPSNHIETYNKGTGTQDIPEISESEYTPIIVRNLSSR